MPPGTPIVIGVGPSPFTFTNDTDNELDIVVAGGTTGISIVRSGVTIPTGAITGMWRLSPQDALLVTYGGTPATLTEFTR
ncbi:hypothetical protein D3C72_1846160 [compost metagenome]